MQRPASLRRAAYTLAQATGFSQAVAGAWAESYRSALCLRTTTDRTATAETRQETHRIMRQGNDRQRWDGNLCGLAGLEARSNTEYPPSKKPLAVCRVFPRRRTAGQQAAWRVSYSRAHPGQSQAAACRIRTIGPVALLPGAAHSANAALNTARRGRERRFDPARGTFAA